MNRKWTLTGCILLLVVLLAQPVLAADSLTGKWSGKAKVSALPFSVSATIEFGENGAFSLSIVGLSVTGSYTATDSTLTVTPKKLSGLLASQLESPENIGAFSLQYSVAQDGSLTMSGGIMGIDGTITATRK